MEVLFIAVRMRIVCKEIVFKSAPEMYETLLIFNVIVTSASRGSHWHTC
jgi:hypothetical protein